MVGAAVCQSAVRPELSGNIRERPDTYIPHPLPKLRGQREYSDAKCL